MEIKAKTKQQTKRGRNPQRAPVFLFSPSLHLLFRFPPPPLFSSPRFCACLFPLGLSSFLSLFLSVQTEGPRAHPDSGAEVPESPHFSGEFCEPGCSAGRHPRARAARSRQPRGHKAPPGPPPPAPPPPPRAPAAAPLAGSPWGRVRGVASADPPEDHAPSPIPRPRQSERSSWRNGADRQVGSFPGAPGGLGWGAPAPRPRAPPRWDLGLLCRRCPPSIPSCRVLRLAGWVSRPLGDARAAVACLERAGYSSPGEGWVWPRREGFGADVGHFPPGHLFSACRRSLPSFSSPSAPSPRLPWGLEREWGDRGAAGQARGAPLGEVGPAPSPGRAAPAVGRVLGARPGPAGRWGPSRRRAIGRIWGRRSRGAPAECLRPDGGPLGGAEKLRPRPRAPSPPAPLAAQVCRPEVQRSFLIF